MKAAVRADDLETLEPIVGPDAHMVSFKATDSASFPYCLSPSTSNFSFFLCLYPIRAFHFLFPKSCLVESFAEHSNME